MSLVYADSVEYVMARVKATQGGNPYDPTDDEVSFAFLTEGQAESTATWVPGSWETISGRYYAKCLRGTDVLLSAGEYTVLCKVVTDEETIIRTIGQLTVL